MPAPPAAEHGCAAATNTTSAEQSRGCRRRNRCRDHAATAPGLPATPPRASHQAPCEAARLRLGSRRGQPIVVALGPAVFDRHVPAFLVAGRAQALPERAGGSRTTRATAAEISDDRHRRLRARPQAATRQRAADQPDELSPPIRSPRRRGRGQVLTDFREQLTWAKRFADVGIATGRMGLVLILAQCMGGDRDHGDGM